MECKTWNWGVWEMSHVWCRTQTSVMVHGGIIIHLGPMPKPDPELKSPKAYPLLKVEGSKGEKCLRKCRQRHAEKLRSRLLPTRCWIKIHPSIKGLTTSASLSQDSTFVSPFEAPSTSSSCSNFGSQFGANHCVFPLCLWFARMAIIDRLRTFMEPWLKIPRTKVDSNRAHRSVTKEKNSRSQTTHRDCRFKYEQVLISVPCSASTWTSFPSKSGSISSNAAWDLCKWFPSFSKSVREMRLDGGASCYFSQPCIYTNELGFYYF